MTVRMTRDAEYYPAPHTADIHPDEVENAKADGWRVADPRDGDGDGKVFDGTPAERPKRRAKEA